MHLGHAHRVITRQGCFESNMNMLISIVLISMKQVMEASLVGDTFLPHSRYHGDHSARIVPTTCPSPHLVSQSLVLFVLESCAVHCEIAHSDISFRQHQYRVSSSTKNNDLDNKVTTLGCHITLT